MKSLSPLAASIAIILLMALVGGACAFPTRSIASHDDPPESKSTPPEAGENEGALVCPKNSGFGPPYLVCKSDDEQVLSFDFINDGPNNVVRTHGVSGEGPEREFGFYFPGRKRQDIFMSVIDAPSDKTSDFRDSHFYFFPRDLIPSISSNGSDHEVLLPTGEKVIFDAKTHEIKGGALTEEPLDQSAYQKNRGLFSSVKYVGPNVVIRVNRRGGDPRLGTVASVSKNCDTPANCQKCSIPSQELWTQKEDDIHFKFPLDYATPNNPISSGKSIDEFLKKRCGFGIAH